MIKLYHGNISTCSQKVRLALVEKGVAFEDLVLNLRAGDQYDPDYLKLNPNAVVPTLVNGDDIVIDSTIINEYIDEAFAGPALKPGDPAGRAAMRTWTKQLDVDLHQAIVILSFCIAFRNDFLVKSPEEMETFYRMMTVPERRKFYQAAISQGMDLEGFVPAVKRYRKLIDDIELTLKEREWLAGPTYSLADIGIVPYMTRLEHLCMADMWADKPGVRDWYDRAKRRPAYQTAVTDWLPDPPVSNMNKFGEQAWPRIREILEN